MASMIDLAWKEKNPERDCPIDADVARLETRLKDELPE